MNVDLDDSEASLVRSLIRQEIRRTCRKRLALIRKFAGEADLSSVDLRENILDDLYIRLGGSPENISNVQYPPTSGMVNP